MRAGELRGPDCDCALRPMMQLFVFGNFWKAMVFRSVCVFVYLSDRLWKEMS